MSEKLEPCPFCGKMDTVGVFAGSELEELDDLDDADCFAVCCDATTCGCGAVGGHSMTKETAIKRWNRRAPLYTPVRREDITDGVYWAVTPDKRTFTVEILRGEAYWGKRQDLSVFLRDFPTLYSIPPLNLEGAE